MNFKFYFCHLSCVQKIFLSFSIAEEKFLQSLKLFETVAPGDAEILIILKNLGRFYLQRNRFVIDFCYSVGIYMYYDYM